MAEQPGSFARTIAELRDRAGLSQGELAKRLPFTASRVSRLESGEIALSAQDAQQVAEAIGTQEALAFAEYLRWEWKLLPRPTFHHPSLRELWEAERALQRLQALTEDPQLKNAFLQQVDSTRRLLERCANYLLSTEHRVAFFGSPGVGKTTLICALSNLRNLAEQDPSRQMVLQTGSGRNTLCDVHVRTSGEYGIIVDPCTTEEIRQYVSEMCDQLLAQNTPSTNGHPGETGGLSTEVERALRNMTGLIKKKVKESNGKTRLDDPAVDLLETYPTKEALMVEIVSRMELGRRTETSLAFPRELSVTGLQWVGETFAKINNGLHPRFSLPRRIEITLPIPILGRLDLDVKFIDTRGIDEPAAPRRDVQDHLDNDRTITVFCSEFKSAPDAAIQAVIERATAGGLRDSILHRGLLAILPQKDQESEIRDSAGDFVTSSDEGREIRRDQLVSTLGHLGVRDLAIEFFNILRDADYDGMRDSICAKIDGVRATYAEQIRTAGATVDRLIKNKASEESRAVYLTATKPLRVWFQHNRSLPESDQSVQGLLLEEFDGLRYASSLRASVNRRGSWHNFDYWHGLGFGARREAFARSSRQVTELKGHIGTSLNDSDLEQAHDFLRQFQAEIERALGQFYQDVQSLGETAFLNQLQGAQDYWLQCVRRWGEGQGYKTEIKRWTESWFTNESRQERHEFIEMEIQRRWRELIERLGSQVASFDQPNDDAVGVLAGQRG